MTYPVYHISVILNFSLTFEFNDNYKTLAPTLGRIITYTQATDGEKKLFLW